MALIDISQGQEVCSVGSTNTENTTLVGSLRPFFLPLVTAVGKMYTGCYEENIKEGLPESQPHFYGTDR